MRNNNVIILIIAIAMGGGAAYLARSWLQGQLDASAYQPPSHIVVAAEPLAYGAAVTADNVSEIPWYTKTLPEGAFATKDDLLNGGRRTVLYPLKRGEPLLRSKVTGPGQRASLAAVLEEGKRAVTVRVDDVRGVAGFVLPGDFVDIVMIADELSSKHQSYSDILLEHVKVLAIDQIASEGEEKPKVAQAVTLEVTKEQAQKILLATNIGKLSLLLGRPIESVRDQNRRIGEQDIGRTIPQRPAPPPPPPPPAPVVKAPPPPSNLAKVTIVRNGESKEYSVTRSADAATQGRRLNRDHGAAAD
jgi:pilus assembly protein CpaB